MPSGFDSWVAWCCGGRFGGGWWNWRKTGCMDGMESILAELIIIIIIIITITWTVVISFQPSLV